MIGGGLLGLEVARGLAHHGVSVTVFHLMDRLMEQQLDAVSATMLKREIERFGIGVRLNTTATEILGAKQVDGVRLTSGEIIPAGMVVICTGVRPDTALAKTAGLQTNRGILVDDRLQASDPSIFAVGDAIEHRGRTSGLADSLREQARVVAEAMVGQGALRYAGTVCVTTLKVAGVHLASAGNFLGGAGHEETVFADTQAGVYKKLVLKGNRLVGMILLGDNRGAATLAMMIQSGSEVSNMKARLLGHPADEAGPASSSPLPTMPDREIVCTCLAVTKGAVVTAIREQGLATREDVAASTGAGTGCGACAQIVLDLLQEAWHRNSNARPVLATASQEPNPAAASPGHPPGKNVTTDMRMIQAIIRPEREQEVVEGLEHAGFYAFTRLAVFGRGRQRGLQVGPLRYEELAKVWLMVVVADSEVEQALEAIKMAARTGNPGDGKIFVAPLAQSRTIRTKRNDPDPNIIAL